MSLLCDERQCQSPGSCIKYTDAEWKCGAPIVASLLLPFYHANGDTKCVSKYQDSESMTPGVWRLETRVKWPPGRGRNSGTGADSG